MNAFFRCLEVISMDYLSVAAPSAGTDKQDGYPWFKLS